MACHHPHRAWRTPSGAIAFTWARDYPAIDIPCGSCLGCSINAARGWALRCHLELQQHHAAAFTTLTYDEKHRPPTLQKRHLQLFLKRFRKTVGPRRAIRFFASGEYGEQNNRPHYHAILYGADVGDKTKIEAAWGQGFTYTEPITPQRISYVAGYTAKKLGWKEKTKNEQVDPETGEVYTWQPPFIQMSRRPGIGGHARQWPESWRDHAIYNGTPVPVPRFLHEAWKQQATEEEIKTLIAERAESALRRDTTTPRLEAEEKLAIARQQMRADKRHL